MPAPAEWDRDPDRRLRIGYVSPNFREHVVGFNLLPLFRNHDRKQFDIFCYSDVVNGDVVTAEFRSLSDTWRDVFALADEALARQVREDRIDILVDLTLHMAGHRLPVFARKPAPVQATFAGYPGSTGLEAVDYRLTDPHLDPDGHDKTSYAETSIRLPHSFWCYEPREGRDIPVCPLPATTSGHVTFGCLNNFCKISEPCLLLWARVMRTTPGSRLILLTRKGRHRSRALDVLASEAITADRIEFLEPLPRAGYLRAYHRIDIGLDSFPYNGHTTSLDSLWMGVPVVTLRGGTVVGRAGVSQLMNLGLPELIASDPEAYVRIASGLAGDVARLATLRAELRSRMESSPLMDAPGFAKGIEAAYRTMWQAAIRGKMPGV